MSCLTKPARILCAVPLFVASMLVAGSRAQAMDVASYPVTLQDQIDETTPAGRDVARFRFVMPDLSDDAIGYGDVADGLLALCQNVALPALATRARIPDEIIISLAAEALPYGEARPEIRQIFEVFLPQNGTCIWGDL